MKFNRADLVAQIEKRVADAVSRVVADAARSRQEYLDALAAWVEGPREKLVAKLNELLDRDSDEPITYGDVSDLGMLVFRGGAVPVVPNREDVQTSRPLAALLSFLRSRDDEVISTYGLEEVGFAAGLRELHDPHARVAWYTAPTRSRPARRAS